MQKILGCALVTFAMLFSINSYADIVYYEGGYTSSSDDSSNYRPHRQYRQSTRTVTRTTHHSVKKKRANPSAPTTIADTGDKVIVINPRSHTWGAYSGGRLLRSGLASAGSGWCADLGRSCRTKTGVFRIYSLGSSDCYSKRFPLGRGGAPMPYCMYFNGGQGLHGSDAVGPGNYSHGCVRVEVEDARWIRFNFARIGTKVIVKPY